MLTNPQFVLKIVTIEEKMIYLAQATLPVLGLPLFAGRRRIVLVYGFLFIFLASRQAVYLRGFQYAAVFCPFLLSLTPFGINALGRRLEALGVYKRRHLWTPATLGVLLCSVLFSFKYGAFVENTGFRQGFQSRLHQVAP